MPPAPRKVPWASPPSERRPSHILAEAGRPRTSSLCSPTECSSDAEARCRPREIRGGSADSPPTSVTVPVTVGRIIGGGVGHARHRAGAGAGDHADAEHSSRGNTPPVFAQPPPPRATGPGRWGDIWPSAGRTLAISGATSGRLRGAFHGRRQWEDAVVYQVGRGYQLTVASIGSRRNSGWTASRCWRWRMPPIRWVGSGSIAGPPRAHGSPGSKFSSRPRWLRPAWSARRISRTRTSRWAVPGLWSINTAGDQVDPAAWSITGGELVQSSNVWAVTRTPDLWPSREPQPSRP